MSNLFRNGKKTNFSSIRNHRIHSIDLKIIFFIDLTTNQNSEKRKKENLQTVDNWLYCDSIHIVVYEG